MIKYNIVSNRVRSMKDEEKYVNPLKESVRITIIYGIIGGLWILLSDKVLAIMIKDYNTYQIFQTYKGWFYVLMTMVLLYCLIYKRFFLSRHIHSILKKQKDDLMLSQQRYELAVDGVHDAIWDWDLENDLYYLSPKWQEKIMGSDKKVLSFKDWLNYIHPDDKSKFIQYIENFKKMGMTQYKNFFRIVCQDNKTLWLYSNGKAILNDKKQVVRIAGSHTDITKHLQLKEEIKKNNDLIKNIFKNTSNFIIIWNHLGEIIEVNPQVEKIIKKDLTGLDFFDTFIPHLKEDERLNIIDEIIHKEAHVVDSHIKKDDLHVLWTNNLLYQSDENFTIISMGTDISQLTKMKKELNDLAYYDKLTGLPNRYLFQKHIRNIIMYNKEFALVCVDIDNIKQINDTLGHYAGDLLIKKIGTILNQYVEKSHYVSRYGGDKFLIIYDEIDENKDLIQKIKDTYHQIKKTWRFNNHEFYITASIGIALYPIHGKDYETLFKNADTAMNYAKESGKDKIHLYHEIMNQKNNQYIQSVNYLKKVIENNDFMVYYQPIMLLKDNEVAGFEALLRFKQENQIVLPAELIEIAEKTGMIHDIDKLVFEKVCYQKYLWKKNGYDNILVSVNISYKHLNHNHLIEDIKEVIKKYDIAPHTIQFEITETTALENINKTYSVLKSLKDMGFIIALDDFGTGFSSLTHLKKLPIDVVKIDREFVRDIMENDNVVFIKSIIQLAQGLRKEVTAEGIETKEQLTFLINNQCDLGQGFYYDKALPPEKIVNYLEK